MSKEDFGKRLAIFKRAESHKWSVKYTYLRNYFAAKWVGWLGWILDIFTAIVGGVLIYMLTRTGEPDVPLIEQLSSLTPSDLAIIILFGSLISSFYGPKLRSRKYYNAGQDHQELYDQIVDFIEIEVADPDKEISELQNRLNQLNKRRHRLNQSTPQLGGIWYYSMKIWGWLSKKVRKSYCFLAPWKKTPEDVYQTLHPLKETPDEDQQKSPCKQLMEKMNQYQQERCNYLNGPAS